MKKKVMIGICVLLAIVLLVPIPMRLKEAAAQLSIELSCIRLKTYIGWVRWIRPG